jgi:predicted  nucleic acid-binding Zn-ribbon protein
MPEAKSVKQDLELLKQLQILDKQIYDLSQELQNIPSQISAADADYSRAQKSVHDLEEMVKQAKVKQKEKELELGQKEEQILKRQGQLNLVKTNEEYTAIRLEISSMKADNSVLEEAILILMDEVEKVARQTAQGKEVLRAEEKKLSDRKAQLKSQESACQARIQELKAQRKDSISHVSREVSSFYDRILSKKNGVALARIDGENCSSCQMKLRPQVLNEVKRQESLILCENCTRILYEEEAS